MNTSKQNALIAEFMGLSYCTKHNYEGWYKNNEHNHRICSYDGLEYHKDWNLLIRVAEKIKSLGYFVDMKYLGTTYGSIKKSWDDMTELVHISDLPNPFVSNPPTALNPMFIGLPASHVDDTKTRWTRNSPYLSSIPSSVI